MGFDTLTQVSDSRQNAIRQDHDVRCYPFLAPENGPHMVTDFHSSNERLQANKQVIIGAYCDRPSCHKC
jgi:hypothetical protein